MDIVRLMFFAVSLLGFMVVHATLFVFNEGMHVWSGETEDGWHVTCHYYTPFRLFTKQIYLGQDCPARMSAPGARRI